MRFKHPYFSLITTSLALLISTSSQAEFDDYFERINYSVGSITSGSSNYKSSIFLGVSANHNYNKKVFKFFDLGGEVSFLIAQDHDLKEIFDDGSLKSSIPGEIILNASAILTIKMQQFLDYKYVRNISIFGTAGLDLIDNSSITAGGGLKYKIDPEYSVTGEYTYRGDHSSGQAKLIYRF